MTDSEFYTIAGYLANSVRRTNIEVEMSQSRSRNFIYDYAKFTNGYPLPIQSTRAPYYIWRPGVNKWGLQSRIYFFSANALPQLLDLLLEPRRLNNRPGYTNWNKRISNNNFVLKLFSAGFVLGSSQSYNRILSYIPNQYLNDFNTGYNII